MDLMWTTGARISEVSPHADEHHRRRLRLLGDPQSSQTETRSAQQGSASTLPRRSVPIVYRLLQDRIQHYLYTGHFKKGGRIFPMARQTENRHIDAVVEQVGGALFRISSHTFRHSFAIHLLLHGRPLKYVSKPLGHKAIESTDIYTNVLTIDGVHFLEGVEFH